MAFLRVGNSPCIQIIITLVENFEVEGFLKDKPQPCQPMCARNEENIDQVKMIMKRSPTKTIRKVASEVELSRSVVQQIVKLDLQIHPYRATLARGLHENDLPKLVEFCKWYPARCKQKSFVNGILPDVSRNHSFFTWFSPPTRPAST